MLKVKSARTVGFVAAAALLLAGLALALWPTGAAQAQDSRTYSIGSAVTAGEGEDASLTITLGQNAPTGGLEFSVTPTYTGGMGRAAAADVSNIPATVTVPHGDSSATLRIALAHDQVEESDETFTVVIATQETGWSAASGGTDTATVTIQDRTVVVNFDQTAYTVTEGTDNNLMIALRLSRAAGREALINVNSTSGDRTTPYSIQIDATDAGAVEKLLWNLPDDDVAQAPWRYTLSLDIPEPAESAGFVAGTGATAMVTIHDDDPLADLQATSGDGQLSLAWTAPAGTVTGYDVQYKERDAPDAPAATPDDPSTGWVDAGHGAVATSHTITGLKNNLRHVMRVRAVNDTGSGPWSVTGGVPTTDPPRGAPTLEFSRHHGWLNEGSFSDYPVILSHNHLPVDTTVKIRVIDLPDFEKATETEDYTLSTRTLTLYAYEANEPPSVRVSARADRKTEGFEVVTLELVPVDGAPYTLGDNSRINIFIYDYSLSPELTISADTGSSPVSEGSTVQVTVRLPQSAPKGGTTVFPFALLTSTATEGETGDFTLSHRALRIPEGEDSATATLTIIDDDEIEHAETIVLGATSRNPRLTAASHLSITVQDNDPADLPPLHLNQAPTVSAALSDATIVNESGSRRAALAGVFSDVDGFALTLTAASSDETVATVSVASDFSTLTANARSRGTATITVTADDGRGGTVSDEFTVTVKAAPVVASPLPDVSDFTVGETRKVSLSGVFSDADGDDLTLSHRSSNLGVAWVARAVDGSGLIVSGESAGTATVTVTARDSDGNRVSDAFEVTVTRAQFQQLNNPPTVSAGISDATIVSESGTHETSLTGVFADGDGDDLTITAASSDESVATASVSADHSTLTVTVKARGTATITVTAVDGYGGSVEDSFTVTVKAAPVVAQPLGDVIGLELGATHDVSMSGVFSDADGDTVTVTEASSSDTSIAAVSVAIDGSTTAITAVTVFANSEGTATITVTAKDSDGNTVSDAFDVTVPAAEQQQQQRGVELPGPVLDLELTATHDSVSVSWSAPESEDAPDGYIVNIKRQGGGDGETRRPGAGKTTLTFRDLNGGSTYEVWVRAQNAAGKGERTHATITLPVELPGPVTGLEVTATESAVTVSWSAPETGGAPDGYIVHLKPEDGGKGRIRTPRAKKTQVSFDNLESGKTYRVWVRAQNAAGKGERIHASVTLP